MATFRVRAYDEGAEGAWADVERRIVVSGGERIRTFSALDLSRREEVPLCGAGALCAGGGRIFCASDLENVIYRLNASTLLPESVYAGGPGMRTLCLSRDGERLFVLLSDADSVLMLSAADGSPLMLARVGVFPQSLRLSDTGEYLVIGGGKDGCAYLLCAQTLRLIRRECRRGFCVDAAFGAGRIRARRLAEEAAAFPLWQESDTQGLHLRISPVNSMLYIGREGGWRLLCGQARCAAVIEDNPEIPGEYSP